MRTAAVLVALVAGWTGGWLIDVSSVVLARAIAECGGPAYHCYVATLENGWVAVPAVQVWHGGLYTTMGALLVLALLATVGRGRA